MLVPCCSRIWEVNSKSCIIEDHAPRDCVLWGLPVYIYNKIMQFEALFFEKSPWWILLCTGEKKNYSQDSNHVPQHIILHTLGSFWWNLLPRFLKYDLGRKVHASAWICKSALFNSGSWTKKKNNTEQNLWTIFKNLPDTPVSHNTEIYVEEEFSL